MNFFIINAHQKYKVSPGVLNSSLVEIIKNEITANGHQCRISKIEDGYDIKTEIQNHVWADIIIMQSPVYWFGTPWLYKKYVDEVFTYSLGTVWFDDGRTRQDLNKQYGTGGNMYGKKYMISLTLNAPEVIFGDNKQYLFSGLDANEFFIANTSVYKFCGAEIVSGFFCYDVMKNATIEKNILDLKDHLKKYFFNN